MARIALNGLGRIGNRRTGGFDQAAHGKEAVDQRVVIDDGRFDTGSLQLFAVKPALVPQRIILRGDDIGGRQTAQIRRA